MVQVSPPRIISRLGKSSTIRTRVFNRLPSWVGHLGSSKVWHICKESLSTRCRRERNISRSESLFEGKEKQLTYPPVYLHLSEVDSALHRLLLCRDHWVSRMMFARMSARYQERYYIHCGKRSVVDCTVLERHIFWCL